MPSPKETIKEIQQITRVLRICGYSNEENAPVQLKVNSEFTITTPNAGSLSRTMKNLSYEDKYTHISKNNCFNLKLLDGGLIGIRYIFDNRKVVIKHHLSYYPSPHLRQFQDEPEIYEEDMLYADIVSKDVMPCPIRIDYDSSSYAYCEHDHTYTHMTLGHYKNCRIPVSAPLTPWQFTNFIFRNFYNQAFTKDRDKFKQSSNFFPLTLSASESQETHLFVRNSG